MIAAQRRAPGAYRTPGAESGGRPDDEATRLRWRSAELALATVAFTSCFYVWSLLGPLGPGLQEALGLSDLRTAVMIAVPVLLGSLMRIPLGWLTDRHGGRRVLGALMVFTSLPLVALALWHGSLEAIVVFGLLLGVAGASFAAGVPFVNGWYSPEHQGGALGVFGMGMGGAALAGLTAPAIADRWGLAAPFWVGSVLMVAMCVVFVAFARDAPPARQARPATGMLASLSMFRRSSRAWALGLFYALAFGGFVSMFAFLPTLLVGVHDLSRSDAGTCAAVFAAIVVIGRPIGGWLADRIGAAGVLRAGFVAIVLVDVVLAAAYTSMPALTVACLALALALGLSTGAVFKLVPLWFPGRVGAVTGAVGAAGGLGGFFPPLVMGLVKSVTGGYALGFALMAVVAQSCVVVVGATRGART